MAKRFFKLLYAIALIVLGISAPIYLLTHIKFNEIVNTTYKAKCLSNNQYVVLQGSPYNDIVEFNEIELKGQFPDLDAEYPEFALKNMLNFYCKYYDRIQPHIVAYNKAKTADEIINANSGFNQFRNSIPITEYSYPQLYKLEVVSKKFQPYVIYAPVMIWFVVAGIAFALLQAVRICYVYVVFGKIVWNPFKSGM